MTDILYRHEKSHTGLLLEYERIIGYTHRARELARHQTFPYSCEFV